MNNTEIIKKSLVKRYKKEKRFQMFGRIAVFTGFAFLVILMTDIHRQIAAGVYAELR